MNKTSLNLFVIYGLIFILLVYLIFPGILIGLVIKALGKDSNKLTPDDKNKIIIPFYPVFILGQNVEFIGRFYEKQIEFVVN